MKPADVLAFILGVLFLIAMFALFAAIDAAGHSGLPGSGY